MTLGNCECSWAASQFNMLSGAGIWFFVLSLGARGGRGVYVQVVKEAEDGLYLPTKETGWKAPSETFVIVGENSHDVVTSGDIRGKSLLFKR